MIMINSGREWDWMDKKTKMSKEELDNFLLNLLNADKVSIRRKLIYMKKIYRRKYNTFKPKQR